MASVGSAIRAACLEAQVRAARRAIEDRGSPLFGASADELEWSEGVLRRRGEPSPALSYRDIVIGTGAPVEAAGSAERDPGLASRYSMHSFGAVFAEVAIDPDVATIRVRRIVGAYAIDASSIRCSREANARAA